MLIHFQNVCIRRYDAVILENLDWAISAGEQWAIVGENGSGKSTLLEVLAGKWPVWRGKLTHGFGEGMLLYKVAELVASDYTFNRVVQAAAQYYQQRFHSHEAARAPTLREVLMNVMRPVGTINEKSVKRNPSDVCEKDLLKICDLLSLTALLDHPFVTLSNGETRRMLLARSLLKKPQLLLLDNPFAGLDVRSREVLQQALQTLKTEGVLVVLTTPEAEIPDSVTHVHRLPPNNGAKSSAASTAFFLMPDPVVQACDWAIEMKNVSVTYGAQKVLDNINWQVRVGEKWALSGLNGSGKSTLLSLLTADNPQRFANNYELFGQKRGGASMWDAKRLIGHVSPEMHLYFPPEITVFKAIASGFFDATGVYFRKLTEEQIQAIHDTAAALQVVNWLEKPFKSLSKGQQRLVLLARALVKNPPLLILDEPCQGLDFAAVAHFKDIINRLCEASTRTLIYVSHYAHEVPSCVTQTFLLENGRQV